MPLFELAKRLFANNIWAYYYDLTFAETLIRHNSKSNRDDFGKKKWKNGGMKKTILESSQRKLFHKI